MALNHTTIHRLYWTALIIAIVGAITLGIAGLTGANLLAVLFGGEPWLLRTIYLIIGLAGAYLIYHAVRVDRPTRRTAPRRTY